MALDGSLFLHLIDQFVHMHGYRPGTSEVHSWERSLPILAAALNDADLGDVEMMLEYALPLNSKRADVVLAGVHPSTGEPSYVVVERQILADRQRAHHETRLEPLHHVPGLVQQSTHRLVPSLQLRQTAQDGGLPLQRVQPHSAQQCRRPRGADEPPRQQPSQRSLREVDGHGQRQVVAGRAGERVVSGGEPGEAAQPDVGVFRAVAVPFGERVPRTVWITG